MATHTVVQLLHACHIFTFNVRSFGIFQFAFINGYNWCLVCSSPAKITRRLLQSLPPVLDWRVKGKVTIPKQQGFCRSPWAFAGIAVIESRMLIKANLDVNALTDPFDLSEQQTVSYMWAAILQPTCLPACSMCTTSQTLMLPAAGVVQSALGVWGRPRIHCEAGQFTC